MENFDIDYMLGIYREIDTLPAHLRSTAIASWREFVHSTCTPEQPCCECQSDEIERMRGVFNCEPGDPCAQCLCAMEENARESR